MIILSVRTDKPDAELGLYNDDNQLAYSMWLAHRQLAETMHLKIKELLVSNNYELSQLEAIVIYKGPGSFTGLRIGFSVANALANSLKIPIVSQGDENWITEGHARIANGESEQVAQPEYGSPPHITQQKH